MCQRDTLSAVLITCDLRNDLGRNVACRGKAVRLLDQCLADDRTVLEHILEIHQIAVMHMLRIVVRIMEMDDTLAVCLHNIRRQQQSFCDILADFARHIITLYTVYRRIFVGIFLFDLLAVALDQGKDPVIGRVCLTHERTLIAVNDVVFRHIKSSGGQNLLLYHILDFLNGHRAS